VMSGDCDLVGLTGLYIIDDSFELYHLNTFLGKPLNVA
jgi:hypothetical protein